MALGEPMTLGGLSAPRLRRLAGRQQLGQDCRLTVGRWPCLARVCAAAVLEKRTRAEEAEAARRAQQAQLAEMDLRRRLEEQKREYEYKLLSAYKAMDSSVHSMALMSASQQGGGGGLPQPAPAAGGGAPPPPPREVCHLAVPWPELVSWSLSLSVCVCPVLCVSMKPQPSA